MAVLIRIVGLATGVPTDADGSYVQSYTPHGHDGTGDLVVTRDRAKAHRYASTREAFEEWRAVSNTHPLRPDGKPNRPMTAWTIEMERE